MRGEVEQNGGRRQLFGGDTAPLKLAVKSLGSELPALKLATYARPVSWQWGKIRRPLKKPKSRRASRSRAVGELRL